MNISAAAREAARADGESGTRMKLPDSIVRWFTRDFPQDILDEAKARLTDIRDNGAIGAEGPQGLPLLPENQKLLDGFRAERRELAAKGHANMSEEQSARFNLLINLDMRLQLTGWKSAMTEADVQREFDVSNAMGKLAHDDPSLRPAEPPVAQEGSLDIQSESVPTVWRTRWEEAGLTMPPETSLSPGHSMWLDLAGAAGIDGDEFMAQLREMAGSLSGRALTSAIEAFISERYVALTEANAAGVGPA